MQWYLLYLNTSLSVGEVSKIHTVLITGACGGIGSKLVPYLVSKGLKIIALDDLSSGTWDNLPPDLPITKLTVDITQQDELEKSIEGQVFEFCIHLAAVSSLPECQENPNKAMEVNFLATVNLVEICAKQANFSAFIFASTSAVYEGLKEPVFNEDLNCNPYLCYPLTKHFSEKYLISSNLTRGFPIVITRLFNVFGDYQNSERKSPPLINYLVRELCAGRSPILYGKNAPKRDYISVDSVVYYFYEMLKNRSVIGNTYNICSGSGYDVKEIYSIVSKTLESDLKPEWKPAEKIWSNYESLNSSYFQLRDDLSAAETNKQSIGSPEAIHSKIPPLNGDVEQEIAEIVLKIKKRLENI